MSGRELMIKFQADPISRRNGQAKMALPNKNSKLSIVILTTIFVIVLCSSLEHSEATSTNSTSSTIKSLQVANSSRPTEAEATMGKARLGSGVNNNSTLAGKKREGPNFGDQAASSIFKPSFFKTLLGDRRRPAAGGHNHGSADGEEEEEEEVTKTIVMPIKEPLESSSGEEDATEQPETMSSSVLSRKNQLHKAVRHPRQRQRVQPKAEASLQLTSTEMNSILNDGEAPDFYRERERTGEGVFVGEEQNRLWTSASNGFNGMGGSQLAGGGGFLGPSFDASGGDLMNNRLAHAASEAGFNHRFGATFNADSELAGYGGGSSGGRLMQSPNEYSEFQAGNEYSNNGVAGYGSGPADYSPQSGLLRAGSGEMGPEGGYMGAGLTGSGGAGGYGSGFFSAGGSPMLERHASELYGGGETGMGGQSQFGPAGSGDLAAMYNGRLLSAGSHIPNHNSFSGSGYTPSPFVSSNDEYASRFGQAGSMPFDQRGFANSNNVMLRGNSMQAGMSSLPAVEYKRALAESNGLKLMPLSPVVPIAEDLLQANQGSYREASNNVVEKDTKSSAYRSQEQRNAGEQQPQVHESLDDDSSEQGDDSDESNLSNNNANDDSDEDNPARATSVRASRGALGGHSLVLNVPPPSADNSINRPLIDFARVGSAGYLAPQLRDRNREPGNGARLSYGQQRQRFLRKNGKLTAQEDAERSGVYDGIENPAHIGKYIID